MSKLRTLFLSATVFVLLPAAMLSACGDDETEVVVPATSSTGTGASGGGTNSGVCLLNNCSEDAHCEGCGDLRTFCDEPSGTCLACDGEHACPPDLECSEYGLCVLPGSTCPTDGEGNPTVTCNANSDCAACSPMHLVCDTTTQKCGACTPTNTQHCVPTDICLDGKCSPKCPTTCATDNDCGQCGSPGNQSHACFQHKCSQCSDTYECDSDQECLQGKCVPPCGLPGPVSGQCEDDADCQFCGVNDPDTANPNPWTCKESVNGGDHGTCITPADGCEDLGPGSGVLPEPYDDYTQTCSSDANCEDVSIQFNVGKAIRDLIGTDEVIGIQIHDANVDYAMPICASVEILGDIDCGICVPCENDADCQPINIDAILPQIFEDDPLALIAGAVLFDLLFGKEKDHNLNFFCQPIAFGYGACVPCGNPLQPCGDVDGGDGSGACDHPVTEVGGALLKSCGTCAETVCDADAFCCETEWDQLCVDEAAQLCGGCEHDPCTAGNALAESCSACTATVCSYDPYCCQTAWDATCVTEQGSENDCLGACTGCAHSECDVGGPLDDACSACAGAVCAADSFCCGTDWDMLCVQAAEDDNTNCTCP